jgi:hypothetical protein
MMYGLATQILSRCSGVGGGPDRQDFGQQTIPVRLGNLGILSGAGTELPILAPPFLIAGAIDERAVMEPEGSVCR